MSVRCRKLQANNITALIAWTELRNALPSLQDTVCLCHKCQSERKHYITAVNCWERYRLTTPLLPEAVQDSGFSRLT